MAIQKTVKTFFGVDLPCCELSARQANLYRILPQRLVEYVSKRMRWIGRKEQYRLAAIFHRAADRIGRGNGCLANPTFPHEEAESGHWIILAFESSTSTLHLAFSGSRFGRFEVRLGFPKSRSGPDTAVVHDGSGGAVSHFDFYFTMPVRFGVLLH